MISTAARFSFRFLGVMLPVMGMQGKSWCMSQARASWVGVHPLSAASLRARERRARFASVSNSGRGLGVSAKYPLAVEVARSAGYTAARQDAACI